MVQTRSSVDSRGWETPPPTPAANGMGTAGEGDGVVLPRGPPVAPLEPAPHSFSVSLHPGPTGVCGFGGPYGDTVATGAYRAFRVATAAGHCGAFSGGDSSRTSKSQGGNYASTPSPRASPPRLAPLRVLPARPAPGPGRPQVSAFQWDGRVSTQPLSPAPAPPSRRSRLPYRARWRAPSPTTEVLRP